MKVALAQINPTVGDLEGNSGKIVDFHQQAKLAGADLVVFSDRWICWAARPSSTAARSPCPTWPVS
jgi:predicted amidohydrolase